MVEAGQNLTIGAERADLKWPLPLSTHPDGTFIKVNELDLGEICEAEYCQCVCVCVGGDIKETDRREILKDGIKR